MSKLEFFAVLFCTFFMSMPVIMTAAKGMII